MKPTRVAVGRADAAVHVENDLCRRVAVMNPVDPMPGKIGQGFNVRVGGQDFRLEAPHLTARCRLFRDSMTADDPPHRRVEAEPVGIVHVVVATKTAKEGLAELAGELSSGPPETGERQAPQHIQPDDRPPSTTRPDGLDDVWSGLTVSPGTTRWPGAAHGRLVAGPCRDQSPGRPETGNIHPGAP